MNLHGFFQLYANHMTSDDVVAATQSIQHGKASGVLINSPGGTVDNFMNEATALVDQRFTALGLSVGSLAVDYYLCASTRLALPNSTFFIHHPRFRTEDEGSQTLEQLIWKYEVSRTLIETSRTPEQTNESHNELIQVILSMAECQHACVRWVAKRTGLEPGIADRLMRDEVTLTAPEAIQLGFVHRIINV